MRNTNRLCAPGDVLWTVLPGCHNPVRVRLVSRPSPNAGPWYCQAIVPVWDGDRYTEVERDCCVPPARLYGTAQGAASFCTRLDSKGKRIR